MVAQQPLVMVTWHGRMLVPAWYVRHRRIVTMISRHSDGELATRIVRRIGFDVVRGSSTRGGERATLEMLDKVRAGQPAAMIGDGPRGPIYTLKPGTAFLALQTRATVIPATFAADRSWILNSWDRFQIPKPFARVVLLFGEPILPPDPASDVELFRARIEGSLRDLTTQADLNFHSHQGQGKGEF